MINSVEQQEILRRLKEPFAPEDHQERDLPGGGKWFFVRWQKIRDRLDEAYPGWEVEYSDPIYIDAFCVIRCSLTIAGIKRTAPGNGEIRNKRGTPIENATADAFKNAAEAFGVCAYLDEQSKDKREFTLRYLHGQGDTRAKSYASANGWLEKRDIKPATKSVPLKKEIHVATVKQPVQQHPSVRSQLESVCKLCQLQWKDVSRICKSSLKKSEDSLTSADARKIRGLLFIEWAALQFDLERATAIAEWKSFFIDGCGDLDDAALFTQWRDHLVASEAVKVKPPESRGSSLVSRLAQARNHTKHTKEQVAQFCQNLGFDLAIALSDEVQYQKLFFHMLIQWALTHTAYAGLFSHANHCANSFHKFVSSEFVKDPNSLDLDNEKLLILDWEDKLKRKLG